MKSSEIRQRFLDFFAARGHSIINSASLVTTDEKGITNPTLFNSAGMQPLIPYLLGKPHPSGKRLVNYQKCLRTTDIDDIGDTTHATFFEMLGNWSLGDYFKEEAIKWSYEFLTSKKEGLGLDPNRLYVTVFKGDNNAERDDVSADMWKSLGIPEHRIYYKDAKTNWWPAVKGNDTWTGPTGPCSEMFYDLTKEGLGDMTEAEYDAADNAGQVVEIWNDVFMEYEKVDGKIVNRLAKKNVDTGAGLERLATVLQSVSSIYETDLFIPLIDITSTVTDNINRQRIIADHIRAAVFLIVDGVIPSNSDRGYILRRLIRRAAYNSKERTLKQEIVSKLVDSVVNVYRESYPEVVNLSDHAKSVINEEISKFSKSTQDGLKEIEHILSAGGHIDGKKSFRIFSTYGIPVDTILDRLKEKDIKVYVENFRSLFDEEFKKHQELSRTGAEKKFKGGLENTSDPMIIRYHTATHLLHQALHDVIGPDSNQKGSNITAERLRFDYASDAKMSDEQKKLVEEIVNKKIAEGLPMNRIELSLDEARKTGARHFFGEKYGDTVSIYYIGNSLESAYSKEFCGGPHVNNTSELAGPDGKWRFKIVKEEALAEGVRRIKAVLQ